MTSSLSGLNPQQREAVEHGEGPLLILAGAGSGKTRVITQRIAHLVNVHRVPTSAILAMTFTNKAAQEMQQRVAGLLADSYSGAPLISTFHSFCVRLLRRDYPLIGGSKDFVIYADDEQMALVKGLCRQLGLDDKQFTPRTVLSRISSAKNKGWTPRDLFQNAGDPRSERVAGIWERYQAALRQANALDFDDLLLESERLLRESPEAGTRYGERFRFLLIDEYQDTNRPQYELMRLLTRVHQNVCVVGDEDQSIYSWRGADIRNILDFEKDYPTVTLIRLEQNYRSTRNILDAASAVVANNTERKGKTLWTESGAGEPVGYCEAPDGESEALFVADSIQRYLRREPKGHAAILYRTNSQSRMFEEALRRYSLKYKVIGGLSFYERAEVKDLLAYLKLALNPLDSMALLRVINTPTRGIGKTTVEALEQVALQQNQTMLGAIDLALQGQEDATLTTRAHGPLREFRRLVTDLTELVGAGGHARDLLRYVVDRTAYVRLLEQADTPETQARIENIEELLNAAADSAERGETIAEFLDHAALVSDQDEFDETAPVTLMTLHAAKGLEFPYVFLVGLEDGLFPHSRALNSLREMEEERRLCYVGMTRACQRLYVTHASFRRRYGAGSLEPSIPSRFLREVPMQLFEDLSIRGGGGSLGAMTGMRLPAPGETHYVSEGYSQVESRPGRSKPSYNSVDNISAFFRRKDAAPSPATASRPAPEFPSRSAQASGNFRAAPPSTARGLKPGSRVKHQRYGTGTVLRIEGQGEDVKVTVSFPGYGLKKMVEKFASLELA
ncbi:MAG: ATP-dependent helicase [Terriglobales bacterium]